MPETDMPFALPSLRTPCLLLLVLTAGLGCAKREVPSQAALPSPVVTAEAAPAGDRAEEPYLSALSDGRIALSWLEVDPAGGHAMRIAIRGKEGAWSEPHDITRRKDLFVNWADFPSVVPLADGRLLAHWLQRNGQGSFVYGIRIAESRDDGATWSAPRAPHPEAEDAEHGFVSLLPDAGGARVFFLDAGAHLAKAGTPEEPDDGFPMALSLNRWNPDGEAGPRTVLDPRTCDCCQTAAAMTARGPIVVYRDRSEEEVRDIAILREVNGEWTAPAPVHADGWHFEACPVNGPAVAADGERVVVAWFTGAQDAPRVQVAFSSDSGATFGAPVRVDGGTPAGRVDVKWSNGLAWVSWLENGAGSSATVRLRPVRADGTAGETITVAESNAGQASGFPRMAPLGDGVILAWTLPGEPSRVQLARVGGKAP